MEHGFGAHIVAVANQKGGVGKTTTAVSLAAALKQKGFRVLLVDFDPQGNATSSFGVSKRRSADVTTLLEDASQAETCVCTTPYGDLIPAGPDLAGSEIALVRVDRREYRLKEGLDRLRRNYDVVLIDCPPGLGLLMVNALVASDGVLIPLQCEYLALEGLSMMVETVRTLRQGLNPALEIDGFVFTMYDGRTNLAGQVVREVKKYFADKIYKTMIPRNVRLSEAPSHGKPVQFYDRTSKGTLAYGELTEEFICRNRLIAGGRA